MHGGNRWAAAARLGIPPERFIDFSANLNPLGPPRGVRRVLQEAADRIEEYPEPEYLELRQAIAAAAGVGRENVFVGNGASEILQLWAYVNRPARAIVLPPTYGEYARAVRIAGGVVVDGGAHPEATGDVVFCCNPNNPTGRLLAREEVLSLSARGKTLLVDESFLGFAGEADGLTLGREAASGEGVFVLVSLTKLYALPGLRLGYAIAPREAIRDLEEAATPWRVNALAEAAGRAALADEAFREATRRVVTVERQYLTAELAGLPGVLVYPGAANFLLLRVPRTDLGEMLARRGLLVRDCRNFLGLDEYHLRVAVRRREENETLIRALKEILGGDGSV